MELIVLVNKYRHLTLRILLIVRLKTIKIAIQAMENIVI